METTDNHRVLIMRCDTYDPDRIAGIVREGMEELGVVPSGRILLKPNVVIAHPEVFPHAFTRKEFLEGVIRATRDKAHGVEEIAVGERSGITVPTRYNFRNAGYPRIIRKYGVKAYYFDEARQVPIPIEAPERLRDTLLVPEPVARCDFLINLPKFKAHPWCRLTLSLKNYIGLQDDRYRLVDHNSFLEHKIADLQEVVSSKFIAVDGITAGQKMMLTPTPFPLGAIVMGTNACAVDTVGCHMVHVDPKDVIHLTYASDRGHGPKDIGQIQVGGDFPLEQVRERTRNFEFCMVPIDEYFRRKSNLSCTVGSFPEAHSPEYCWGGCPGALQEAMHIMRGFYPDVDREMKKVRYVVGRVEGPLEMEEGERVLFAGSCTRWKGKIDGREVDIQGSYRGPHEVDGRRTESNDMILKTVKTLWHCLRNRSSPYVHAKGCPLSVAEHLHYLSAMGGTGNPNFHPRLVIPVNLAYWQMRVHRFFNRIFG